MVKRLLPILLLGVFASASCERPEATREAAERGLVEGAFLNLAADLSSLMSERQVTSIHQLRVEYSRRYPSAPALFTSYEIRTIRDGLYPPDRLPTRHYFWLPYWDTNDPPCTPMFWSYFALPTPWVEYLSIDGSKHQCSSNTFRELVAPISERVQKANVNE